MAEKPIPADVARMNFEEALAELEGIVRQLEAGTGKLDEAIAAYERGAVLKQHCEKKLKEAQARVDKVVLGPDGSAKTEPMDID
jgi:exodeoxyribonuclease VII small subunit